MKKLVNTVWACMLLLIVCNACVFAEATCPEGTYYDHVTDRCDSCVDICDNARSQGTEETCKHFCPDFTSAPVVTTTTATTLTCPDDHYYDSVVERCDYCSVLCDDDVIQGTTKECKHKCPQYFNKVTHENESTSTLPALIAVVILVSLVALVALYGAVALFCNQRLPRRIRMETCCPRLFPTKKPVQCTDPSTAASSTSSLGQCEVLIEPSGQCDMLIEPSGFTDLCSQRRCSSDESNT